MIFSLNLVSGVERTIHQTKFSLIKLVFATKNVLWYKLFVNLNDKLQRYCYCFRFPDIPLGCTDLGDEDMCRMSAYDNVDDRNPRAPPSETSEQTEFSEPWAESMHGMCSESGQQVSHPSIHILLFRFLAADIKNYNCVCVYMWHL